MGLDIYFPEDIRNALLAANEGSAATAAVIAGVSSSCLHQLGIKIENRQPQFFCYVCQKQWGLQDAYNALRNDDDMLAVSLRAYREGYKAALTTVAIAFGIAPQAIESMPLDGAYQLQGEIENEQEVLDS